MVQATFKGLVKKVFELHKNIFPPAKVSLENFLWAWSIVHSRASVVPGKGLVIVPLADFINDSGDGATGGAKSKGNQNREFAVFDPLYNRVMVTAK